VDISVVVPVFNGGNKIARSISALKRQRTEREFEIIIVDDGSTDGSIQRIMGRDIRIFTQANQGPAAARNLGTEKSRGSIVLFTDADCEPLDNWIEEMVRPLMDPQISGVKGCYLTRQKGIIPRFVQLEYEAKYERMKRYRSIDFIDTYSAAFVKKDFLTVGGFDCQFPTASVEDQEFSFRMWERGYRMVFNPNGKVYHTHSEDLWKYVKKKFRIGFWKALVLRKHPKKILSDSHTPQTLKFEMAFSTLFLIALLMSPFGAGFLLCALLALVGFLATISPFLVRALRKDPFVAVFSPFLLLVRALSLSFGLIAGSCKMAISRGKIGRGVEDKSDDLSSNQHIASG
jgi:glycosyltransferase involved in cell wall biosynthesis